MAGCKSYLRGLSICVTVLLLVSGVVMIGIGFASMEGNTPVAELFYQLSTSDGLLILQILGPVTVILSILGICAATFLNTPLLLLFSAVVFVEFVVLMVVASPLVQAQTELDRTLEDLFLNVTPLYKTDINIQSELSKLQSSDSCCGLRSYEDWQSQIPDSCICTSLDPPPASETEPGSQPVDSDAPCVMATEYEKKWIHSKPCGPILKSYMSFPIKLRIGVISALATLAIAAIALCLTLGLEPCWRTPPVETTVDDFDRVKYQPKPSPT